MRIKFLLLLLSICGIISAGTGEWKSATTGGMVRYTTTQADRPAKDGKGKLMTVVYLENLSCEKIGQNSNADDVAWLLSQGYSVIELDYAHHAKAVSPYINLDIIAINAELNKNAFCGMQNISNERAYVLFEGYRLQRDISYYKDEPKVYNLPDSYKTSEGDSLYLDLAYPANPSRPVPVMLSFSYSNSCHGNEHKRMYLPYTYGMFSDSFLEGAPAVGVAWAIADHPKYCDWGNGKYEGGANKSLGSIELNPDAARKVRSAIRTVRGVGKTIGSKAVKGKRSRSKGQNAIGGDIILYGFSRGSTAASLAIGDAPSDEWKTTDRGCYPDESSDIQCVFLGPGVFDYRQMSATSNEYKRMSAYVSHVAGTGAAADALWAEQGGALTVKNGAVPCFLFYNTDDDVNYDTQMQNLMQILDSTGSRYELLKNFGTGHAVPQKTDDLQRMYHFLIDNVPTGIRMTATAQAASSQFVYDINGRQCPADSAVRGIVIADGRKTIR